MGLNLPSGVRQQAFMAFCRSLMNDPLLRREVRTWRIWDGSHKNELPTVDTMPAVQLRMLGAEIQRWGSDGVTVTNVCKPSVAVDIWVAGTDAGDLYNLYDALDNALFPVDPDQLAAVRMRLSNVGVQDYQPLKEVLPETPSDYTAESVHGAGSYQLTLVVTQ